MAYADFPVVEWTICFRNSGSSNTPILQSIQALDLRMEGAQGGEFVLHGIKGDSCMLDSYEPYSYTLGPKINKTFARRADGPPTEVFPATTWRCPAAG